METKKALVTAIIKFLRSELDDSSLNEEAIEGVGVSIDLLEQAYGEGCSSDDNLLEIYKDFENKKHHTSDEDKGAAEQLKVEGNNLMKEEKYDEAIQRYTQAINLDKRNAVFYCNRAAAYSKLEKNIEAIQDCTKSIEIDPNYGKAYGRMGLAYLNDKKYNKAVEMYEKAVSLEPSNASYQTNLTLAREQIKATQQERPAAANPLAGLDIGSLLSNPAVMNMAQSFMQNPAMQNMFSNMMGGGAPQPSGRLDGNQETSSSEERAPDPNVSTGAPPGSFQMPAGLDLGNIMNATQMMADQLRTQNPDLAESLRYQFQQGQHPPEDESPDNGEKE